MKRSIERPTTTSPPAAESRFRGVGGRLALALAGYALIAAALPLGLGMAFRALFQTWNLTPETVARAPGWARALYAWHGSFITLVVSLLTVCLCMGLRPEKPKRPNGHCLVLSWLAGTGLAFALAALFLMTDSLRLSWPLSSPRLSGALVAMGLLTGLGVAAEEWFGRHVIYEIVRKRWGGLPAMIASTAMTFLFTGGLSGNLVSGFNVALMGLVCVLMYKRHGLWVPVGFRWGWSFSTLFLLGQGGGALGVYRLYGVSESLLTGGDAGFVYGLALTAVLAGMALWMLFQKNSKLDKHGAAAL